MLLLRVQLLTVFNCSLSCSALYHKGTRIEQFFYCKPKAMNAHLLLETQYYVLNCHAIVLSAIANAYSS